jgi:hypothetical protein
LKRVHWNGIVWWWIGLQRKETATSTNRSNDVTGAIYYLMTHCDRRHPLISDSMSCNYNLRKYMIPDRHYFEWFGKWLLALHRWFGYQTDPPILKRTPSK